jgi:predicted TIM-barrel fold metal-dependent hydrolase
MDFEFEDRFRDLMKLKPSEYWQRQCKATFQYDVIGPKLIGTNNLMTVDTLMWGSDYPHTDGIWPESSKYIEEQFRGLSPEDIRKITCDNAAKFYNLTN